MQEVQRASRRRRLPGATARQGGAAEVPGEAQVALAGVVLRRPDPQHLQHQVEELNRDQQSRGKVCNESQAS